MKKAISTDDGSPADMEETLPSGEANDAEKDDEQEEPLVKGDGSED